jgi:uncharacterized protein involved in exopolysaccharide biosynthesis
MAISTPVIPAHLIHPGVSIQQLWAILWARRLLVLTLLVLAVTLTVLVLALLPRTYTATSTLMVNYEVNDPLNGKQLPTGQVSSYIATQVELMQTPEVLLAVVDRLGLTADKAFASGFRGERGTLREWAASALAKHLNIYQGQMGSQLIYISYSGNNAIQAALIANTLAEVYKEQDIARSTGAPAERAARYAEQLRGLKSKVDQSQMEYSSFHQENGLIDEGNDTNVDVILLTNLEGRLLEAQTERRIAQARVAGDPASSTQLLVSTEAQALKAQLASEKLQLAQLNHAYTPSYPPIAEVQAQIDATNQSLAQAIQSYAKNSGSELKIASQLEQNLESAVIAQRAKVLTTGKLRDEAAKYRLELASTQTLYKRALEDYDQIMFASDSHATNIGIVSRATAPVNASAPRVLRGLAAGCMAALALALGIPFGLELFRRRVRCRDDLERHYAIPVLMEFGKLPALSA